MAAAGPRRLLLLPLVLAAALLPPPRGFSSAAAAEAEAEKVSLELYYESLCPYCSRFMVNCLAGIFEDGLIDAVDLRLAAWPVRVLAQHPGGLRHRRLAGSEQAFPFHPLRGGAGDEAPVPGVGVLLREAGARPQARDRMLQERPRPQVQLELKYANQTGALEPPHRYVPWVVVDGQPLLEDYENFEAYISKAYKGSPPKVCEGLGHTPVALDTVETLNRVSYNSISLESKLELAEDEGVESKVWIGDDDN